MMNLRVLSDKEQQRMLDNGWRMRFPELVEMTNKFGKRFLRRETEQELKERLSEMHIKVKVYEVTTAVKGYHQIIAMVK